MYVIHSVVMIVFEGMPVGVVAILKGYSVYAVVVFAISCVIGLGMVRRLVDPLEPLPPGPRRPHPRHRTPDAHRT
ncbi:MAG: hypothetical protein U0835_22260 [Isosphaeraceae bacterium]